MDEDLEPELAGYDAGDDRPLRGRHRATVLRVVVVLGLIALVLPGILVTATTADRTARRACEVYTATFAPRSVGYDVRFELLAGAEPGWNCYAIAFDGSRVLLRSMGLIPGGARLPAGPVQGS